MQLLSLLTTFANQYQQRYLDRANDAIRNLPPGYNRELLPDSAATPSRPGLAEKINDSYQPTADNSSETAPTIYSRPDNTTADSTGTNPTISDPQIIPGETDETVVPVDSDEYDNDATTGPAESTVTVKRQAELGYNLTLQFDMAAFTRTITSMADGEISEIDQIAIASFGLSVDFSLKGKETIEIKSEESTSQQLHVLRKNTLKSRQASTFQAVSRDFAAQAFSRTTLDRRNHTDIKIKDGVRRAVNKFSLRYRSDSRFSFSFAEKFNVQTKQVANSAEASLGKYVESAGEVAATGTMEMMEAFFNAVENYLADNHTQTSESVTAFFGEAAAALGFEGSDLAEFAENNLTSTIDNFFDSVSAAVSQLRELYVGDSPTPDATSAPALSETAVEYLPAIPTNDSSLSDVA